MGEARRKLSVKPDLTIVPDIKVLPVTVEQITPAAVPNVWFQVKPLIDKALERCNGEITSEDVRRAILSERMQLFVAHDKTIVHMALVTEIQQYPRYTALNVVAVSGSLRGALRGYMQDFFPKILEWSQALGVTFVECRCHPTMARLLRGLGFYHRYHVMMLKV